MSLSYEIRPRKDRSGVDLICERLPFGSLWYGEPGAVRNAASYAEFNAGSESATITIFDERGAIAETRRFRPEATRPGNTLGAL